jgi:hypothetical protein
VEEKIMAHNVYINIVLSTDDENFPKDFGMMSEIKKEVGLILQKYKSFKMKRYNFDIIDEEYDIEPGMEFEPDAE